MRPQPRSFQSSFAIRFGAFLCLHRGPLCLKLNARCANFLLNLPNCRSYGPKINQLTEVFRWTINYTILR